MTYVKEHKKPLIFTVIFILVSFFAAFFTNVNAATLSEANPIVLSSSEDEDTSNYKVSPSNKKFYLTYNAWQKDVNPDGSLTFTWNDQRAEIEALLEAGYELYEYYYGQADAGYIDYNDQTGVNAYKCISNAYYRWYDATGFERNVQTVVSGSRVVYTELLYSTARQDISNGESLEKLREDLDTLIEVLTTDANILDGVSNDESALWWANFSASLLIIIREGLEAILVVGAMIAYLIKTGEKKNVWMVYVGIVAAIAASFLLAWIFSLIPNSGMPQEIFEGIVALIAVCVLLYVSNWMISKSESVAWTKYLSSKVEKKETLDGETSKKSALIRALTLAGTAFLAVFREGAEVILFIQPLLTNGVAGGVAAVWLGLAVGFAIVVVVFLLIRFLGIKIPLKPFFMITSIFMSLMVVVFLGQGLKELIEGEVLQVGLIPGIKEWANNSILDFFGIYPTWLTLGAQGLMLAFLVFTFIWHLKRNKKLVEKAKAEDTPLEEPKEEDSVKVDIEAQDSTLAEPDNIEENQEAPDLEESVLDESEEDSSKEADERSEE